MTAVSLFSYDGEKGTQCLINSTAEGQVKNNFSKSIAFIILSIMISAVCFVLFTFNTSCSYDLRQFRAAACSIEAFKKLPSWIKIWNLIAVNFLLKTAAGLLTGLFSYIFVKISENRVAAFFMSSAMGAAVLILTEVLI